MIQLQLQRFAGEKTERATPKRRQEAKKKGSIPKSADLTSAVGLIGALVALRWIGPNMWNAWNQLMTLDLSTALQQPMTEREVMAILIQQGLFAIRAVAPLAMIVLILGLSVSFAQVGPMFVPNLLLPDFSRISMVSGMRRFFSVRSFVDSIKTLLKLVVVGVVAYLSVQGVAAKITNFAEVDVSSLPSVAGGMVFRLGIEVGMMMLVLAGLDFFFQRFEFERNIRMTRQEIREEFKQQEGDPQIRHRIRQRGRQLALRRMMQDVPKADVVITNPTHFAVAIRYDGKTMAAPIIVAKGQDYLAKKIRETAEASGIPLVENKPIARALYSNVEIGMAVPADLYRAVAEILAYVYRVRQGV